MSLLSFVSNETVVILIQNSLLVLDSSDVSPSVFTQAADGEGSTSRRLFRCSRCAQVEAGAQCDGSLVLRCISLPGITLVSQRCYMIAVTSK